MGWTEAEVNRRKFSMSVRAKRRLGRESVRHPGMMTA